MVLVEDRENEEGLGPLDMLSPFGLESSSSLLRSACCIESPGSRKKDTVKLKGNQDKDQARRILGYESRDPLEPENQASKRFEESFKCIGPDSGVFA